MTSGSPCALNLVLAGEVVNPNIRKTGCLARIIVTRKWFSAIDEQTLQASCIAPG